MREAEPEPRRAVVEDLDPTPFGANCHLAHDPLIAELRAIGVTWQRFDVDWDQLEPRQGVFAWGELDRCMAQAERRGVSVFATVAYTPRWASGNEKREAPPRDGGELVRFVRDVVRRYRGRLHALGIWNEPNLQQFYTGSRDFYLRELLVPGLRAIREEAPEIVTCGPDLSSSRGVTDWLGAVLDAAGELLDVVTHHQYDGGDTPSGRAREIDRLRSFLASRGFAHRPLWITETGWDRPRTSAARQAEYLRGTLHEMGRRATWWRKTFWYDSHGPGWGLFGTDGAPDAGRPQPAFDAYREALAGLLPLDTISLRTVVERAYLGILARPADDAGRDAYVRALRQGVSAPQLCASLFASEEFARERGRLGPEEIAAQLYAGILDRPAGADELADAARQVHAGRGAARAGEMLLSPEFRGRFLERREGRG